MADHVAIVPATLDMLDDIWAIEKACFSAPWTRKMMEAELAGNGFARFLVARDQAGGIVAYHCFWIVFEELRLMTLAVSESMRRRGIARRLVSEALRMGRAEAATRAVLEVRASNQAAQALYRHCGFVAVGIRPRYYADPVEDAVLMAMEPLAEPPSTADSSISHVGGGSVPAH